MTKTYITPYLLLMGRAEEAIAFYVEALDAKVEAKQRFGDVDKSCAEAARNNIMHAELRVGDAQLMLSDGPGKQGDEVPMVAPTAGIAIAIAISNKDETRKRFDALARGGKVVEPLFDAPWGALFGVVEDRFGVRWMCNGSDS